MKTTIHLPLLAVASFATSAIAAPLLQIKEDVALQFVGSTAVEYTDNIFFTSTNEEDAFKFTATPGLRLNLGDALSDTYAIISTQEELTAYSSGFSNLNNQLNTTKGQGLYDNGKLRLTAGAGYAESDQNTPDLARNGTLIERATTTYSLIGAYKINAKTSVSTGYDYSETSYENNPAILVALRDNSSWSIPVDFYYEIADNLDVSVGYRHRENKIDGIVANGDSKDNYYNVGLRGDINAKLKAAFNVGYQTRSYSNNLSDTGALGAQGSLTYVVDPKSQFNLNLDTDLGLGASGNSIQRTGAELSYTNQISRDWTLSGFVGYRINDYEGSGNSRSDDNLVTGVSGRYSINRYATLTGRYTLQDNSSETNNNTDVDYTVNTFSLSLDFIY